MLNMTFHSEKVIQINNFDGQTVWVDKIHPLFEVGNFLGGGAAGTVYECEYIKSKERYALKILNPLGYKLMTPTLLRKTHILTKGKPLTDDNDPNISLDHVWWLLNNSTKQYIAAYFSEKSNCLKELSLNQCVAIWTAEPPDIVTIDDENPNTNLNMIVLPNGQRLFVPKIPPKFVEFIRKRSRIFREINNMRKISNHPNVIKLEGVLELVQETKCTIFLVMELANGGELFDRIKVDCGTREDTAKFFFQQLLGGVKHCHDQGVCHRDLKPENLLLQDTSDRGTILKIADFGFSARFAMATGNNNSGNGGITGIAGMSIGNNNNNNSDKESNHWSQPAQSSNQGYIIDSNDYMASGSPVRVLKSIVGSPFYVAPEILQARGYDGAKADIWSLGVILYAMLAGNLPFGQDLSICKRFKTFCKWVRQYNLKTTQLWDHPSLDFPEWLFPSKFSNSSKGLIVSMLHPDPLFRISVAEAMQHPLCIPVSSSELVSSQGREIPMLMSSTDVAATSTDRHDYNDHNDNDDDNNNNSNNNNNGGSSSNGSNSSSKNSNAMIVSHQDSLLMKGAHEEEDDDDGDDKGISVRRSIDESDQETGDEDFRNEEKENDYDDQSGVFIMEEDREEYVEKISSRSMTSTIVSKSQQVSPLSNTSKHDMYNNLFPDMSQSFSTATSSMMSESFLERNNFGLASSPPGAKPPIAHHVEAPHSIDDLITNETDEFDSEATLFGMSKPMHSSSSSGYYDSLPPKGPLRRERSGEDTGSTNNHPPSFTDAVKKSTRFITAVPAFEVLIQVEKILSDCRDMKIITPIGLIGKVILDWDTFRLEVWGQDVSSPSVCALQMYQLPSAYGSSGGSGSTPSTPSRMATTDIFSSRSQAIPINTSQPSNYYSCSPSQGVGSLNSSTSTAQQELYLVEFVRGQLEIFAFKRFYQWLRQKLSELVKKDYSLKLFEHSVSPK